MVQWIHPGVVILLGGLLIPFIRPRKLKLAYFLMLPLLGLGILILTSMGLLTKMTFARIYPA